MTALTKSLTSALLLTTLVSVILTGAAHAGAGTDLGLIAYYNFEEGSGTTLTDLSGNENNGTWVNSSGLSNYSSDVPATLTNSTQAGSFSRTDAKNGDHIDLPYLSLAANAFDGGVTVSFWIKKEGDTKQWAISETDVTNSVAIYNLGIDCEIAGRANFMVRANDYTMLRHSDDLSSIQEVSSNTEPEWHHVAWTDDNGKLKIYIDGILDSTDFTYNPNSTVTCNVTTIGAWMRNASTPDYHFDGLIDDFAAWDYVLTDTQIASLASGTLPTTISVPEPSTIILLLGALGTLLVIRRK